MVKLDELEKKVEDEIERYTTRNRRLHIKFSLWGFFD